MLTLPRNESNSKTKRPVGPCPTIWSHAKNNSKRKSKESDKDDKDNYAKFYVPLDNKDPANDETTKWSIRKFKDGTAKESIKWRVCSDESEHCGQKVHGCANEAKQEPDLTRDTALKEKMKLPPPPRRKLRWPRRNSRRAIVR